MRRKVQIFGNKAEHICGLLFVFYCRLFVIICILFVDYLSWLAHIVWAHIQFFMVGTHRMGTHPIFEFPTRCLRRIPVASRGPAARRRGPTLPAPPPPAAMCSKKFVHHQRSDRRQQICQQIIQISAIILIQCVFTTVQHPRSYGYQPICQQIIQISAIILVLIHVFFALFALFVNCLQIIWGIICGLFADYLHYLYNICKLFVVYLILFVDYCRLFSYYCIFCF